MRRIERHGGSAMAAVGDVSSEDDVVRYVGEVLDAWGRIDILINNAALLGGRGVLEETLEFWNRAIAVAGAGTFLNTKHVAISMIERDIRGSIVNILSSNAWQGCAGVIAYAFHKGGLANFTRAAAMDLAPYGIRVNSYSPTAPRPDNPELLASFSETGGMRVRPRTNPDHPAWWRATGKIDVRSNMPMEPSTPTDIGHCVAWLCSDYARLITGCDFVIDGGARAKYWGYTPPEEKAEAGAADSAVRGRDDAGRVLVVASANTLAFEASLAAPHFVLGPSCGRATRRVLRPHAASTSLASRCNRTYGGDH